MTGVSPFRIRELTRSDVPAISSLLNKAMGTGFWDTGDIMCEASLVADAHGEVIGVGTACLESACDDLTQPPVGHIRLVAVDPAWRGQGVATALVHALVDRCEALGVPSILTYACALRVGRRPASVPRISTRSILPRP